MSIELHPAVSWLVNGLLLTVMHMAAAYAAVRLPLSWFEQERWLTRLYSFERGGGCYERWFRIRSWKDRVPDGGSWFKGGFPKSSLISRSPLYILRFIAETRRGEWTHWAMLLLVLCLGWLWNEGISMLIIACYALVANFPCIMIQRYNRARLLNLLTSREPVCYTMKTSENHAVVHHHPRIRSWKR